jgi:hypothetical protein
MEISQRQRMEKVKNLVNEEKKEVNEAEKVEKREEGEGLAKEGESETSPRTSVTKIFST